MSKSPNESSLVGAVSAQVREAPGGRLTRRVILRRGAAIGVSAPLLAAAISRAPRAAARQETPNALSGEPVVIGAPYNLTGALASLDNPARDGSQLAVDELNAGGGILGRPVELRIYDGKSDVTTVTNIVRQLVEEDQVSALVGLTDTSYVLAAAQVAQDNGVPYLDVGGTAPIITSVGDYVFMIPFGDNVQASVAAEFAQEQGWSTCALLLNEGMDYTKFLAQYFADRFDDDDIGGEIVSTLNYGMGDTDFSGQLTEFKNLAPQPDVLFISAGPDEIGTIVAQARAAGLTMPILGGDGYDTPLLTELGGPAANGVFFTTHQGIYGDDPAGQQFTAAFQEKTGQAPNSVFAALGYDGVRLMADAINRAGALDGDKVRDALAATQGYAGATGQISYEEGSRIPSKSVAIVEVRDLKPTLLKVVVPKTVAPA